MENILHNKFKTLINEIFIAVGEKNISLNSSLVKAATEALKILNSSNPPEIIQHFNNDKFRGNRRMMYEHVIDVIDLILNKQMSFNLACKEVSKRKGITVSSVQQACCRALKLKATDWKKMSQRELSSINLIYNTLVSKYSEHNTQLSELFNLKKV